MEKEREYRILLINIIIGIAIATIANANFFQIVQKISLLTDSTFGPSLNIVPGLEV